jgi:hypothetical protein
MKNMLRNTSVALIAAASLSGCATHALPEYPVGHPANPDSPAGAWDNASVLGTYRPAEARRGSPPANSNDAKHSHESKTVPASSPETGQEHEDANH